MGYYETQGYAQNLSVSEDGLIYVANGLNLGIYRFGEAEVVDNLPVSTPDRFQLYSAYPNPFNSFTTINYSLPNPTNISLAVYNPLGQQVEVLHNGYQTQGRHSATFDGKNLPTGLYFVRLEADSEVILKKTLLIR